jgi:hypothetical protein
MVQLQQSPVSCCVGCIVFLKPSLTVSLSRLTVDWLLFFSSFVSNPLHNNPIIISMMHINFSGKFTFDRQYYNENLMGLIRVRAPRTKDKTAARFKNRKVMVLDRKKMCFNSYSHFFSVLL